MDESKIGILFVHGIVGNNRIFRFLNPWVPEGCERLDVTLAGHGGDASAFSKASMEQWRRQVEDGVCFLASRCDRIVAVCHSMGCLLALGQAERKRVDGLLLLNPPMRIRVRGRVLANVLKVGLGLTGNDERAQSAIDAYGVEVDYNPLHYYGWPMRYVELFRESRRIRDMVEKTRLDSLITVVTGGDDELVSPDSGLCFSRQPFCRVVTLPDAGHYHYSSSDKDVISGLFTELIERVRVGSPFRNSIF